MKMTSVSKINKNKTENNRDNNRCSQFNIRIPLIDSPMSANTA